MAATGTGGKAGPFTRRNRLAQTALEARMYAPNLGPRDRSGAIVAVAAIHVALIFALLNISGAINLAKPQDDLAVFDVTPPEPPPPIEEVKPQEKPAPKEEGEASPPNIKSKASPVVAPKPKIELPITPPVVASPTPNQGSDTTQGAAEVPGPGTGAGGVGTGTGAGGQGNGPGGGGTGIAIKPSLVRGITNRDYPREIQRRWPRGGQIFVRLRIQPDGRPSQCDVQRSYGDPVADQWTCSLIMQRGQFRPAIDQRGVPIAAWYGYVQSDRGRFDR